MTKQQWKDGLIVTGTNVHDIPDNPVCAECREAIESFNGVVVSRDGGVFHGRCWSNA